MAHYTDSTNLFPVGSSFRTLQTATSPSHRLVRAASTDDASHTQPTGSLMESAHHSSDLDPSSILGFGSALALVESPDEVGRLVTGTLRSMGLSDLQAVVLTSVEGETPRVVGSAGTRPLPGPVIDELRSLGTDRVPGAEDPGSPTRHQMDVCPDRHPALAEAGVQRLSVVRLGTVDHDFGIVVAGHAGERRSSSMEASTLQMVAAQASMALHRIRLDRQRETKEEALRSSEARYRELYENAPVAYVSVNDDGEIRMANQRAADLLSTPKETLPGKTLTHFCTDTADAAATVKRLTACIRDNERLYDQEVQICRADGEQIWVSMSVQPIDPTDGAPECLVMMADITERMQMEAALREARDELEERVQDRTAEVESTNDQLRRQTKRLEALREVDRAILSAESPREIATVAARRAQSLVPCERVSVALFDWDDDRVTVLTAQQSDESVLERGTDFPIDEFTLTDDLRAGRIDDMPDFDNVPSTRITDRLRDAGIRSAITVPMHVEDELIGTVNLGASEPHAFTDEKRRIGRELADHLAIALRQSRLLEAVQEQREQLSTLRDIDQAILSAESPVEIASEALQRVRALIPFKSATVTVIDWDAGTAHVLAAPDNVLDAPTTLPLDEVYLSDTVAAGETEVLSDDAYAPVPEAEERMHEMGLRSILCLPMVVEGDVIGVVHVGRTEPDAFTESDWQVGRELADHMAIAIRQSQLLEEVQEQRERLEERVQERTEELESFTYSVSHDLRTPLRAIDGYTRILKEEHADQLDEEGRDLLNVVYESAQTMGDLIDDLLTLSRLGRREMHRVPIDMEALAQEACDELKRAHPDRAEDVTFACRELPTAFGDRSMIRQVFSNLLSNALKFTREEDAPRVEVTAEDRGEEIVYAVRDNGVGFSMEYADKLFGVFERLHDDEAFEGTGVGLAVVERIIRRHGGEVWGKGTEGEGATMFFTLPTPDAAAS